MSVLRKFNFLGSMRIDAPHLRALESSVTSDFDLLAGQMLAGYKPLIIKGFDLVDAANAVGKVATSLQLNVAGGILVNYYASEAGSMFFCPALVGYQTLDGSNSRIQGAFVAGATNYVGVDLVRNNDFTGQFPTTDSVKFLDIVSRTEVTRQVPIGKLLDFKIVITTQEFDFTPSVVPLMKVVTSSSNQVTSITDARNSPYRLGRGGSFPDGQSSYSWTQGREEGLTANGFIGGDKAIASHKDWADAIMSRIWEIGGGKYWYSPTADRNVRMTRTGTTFTNGEWFEWDGTNLHWRGLRIVFDNSGGTVWYNTISDQTTDSSGNYGTLATNLADGDCIYVDIVRTSNSTIGVKKGLTALLGVPTIPGTRFILAWRVGTQVFSRDSAFPVGATFTVATNTNLGIVQLTYAAGSPSVPLVAPQDANGSIKNTATVLGNAGLIGTGLGSGSGVIGNGGASNGSGVKGLGVGTGPGVEGLGDAGASGLGVKGTGGSNVGDIDAIDVIGNAGVLGIGGIGGATHRAGIGGYFKGGADSGGGGGYGVTGLGIGSGVGGSFQGGASGQGVLISEPGTTSYKPLISLKDSSGHFRGGFDHNGFPTGNIGKFEEDWTWVGTGLTTTGAVTAMTGYTRWSYYLSAGGSPALSFAGGQGIDILSPSNANTVGIGPTGAILVFGTDVVIAMEVAVVITGGGTSGCTFGIGLGITSGPLSTNVASDTNAILFRKANGDTNWQAITTASSVSTTTDTTVPPVAGTTQILRIEYYGTNTPRGNVVKFFIDGALVATNSSNIPSTALYPKFNVTYTSVQRTLSVGAMKMYWTRVLDPVEY